MAHCLAIAGRVIAIAVVLTTRAFAATLYVSPSGNDSNPGTLAAPLATPGRALAVAAAGDTVLLRSGTYSITRSLTITKRGVTLRSYPGEWARIVAGRSGSGPPMRRASACDVYGPAPPSVSRKKSVRMSISARILPSRLAW